VTHLLKGLSIFNLLVGSLEDGGGIALTVSFDRVAHIFDKTRGLPPHIMKKLVNALTAELKGCRTILDAGVGTGRFAKPLQNKGFDLVGVDISSKMLERAHQKGVKNLCLADARHLPFRDLSFDATISNHVLHLIEDWKAALREITRVTRSILTSTTYGSPNPLREAYEELLKKRGFEQRRLGISEAELKSFIQPLRFMVAITNMPVNVDKTLAMFDEKACSHQWDVPNHVHRSVMKDLRACFAGKIYYRDVQILVWKTETLKRYLKMSNTSSS